MPQAALVRGTLAVCCALGGAGWPGPAAAQSPPPAPAADSGQRIVIEGRTDDGARRSSTVAMTVVGREELDRQGDISLLDVLQRLPGITVDGDTPRLRGLGAGYTLILLNGEPAPPGFSLDSLAPGDIERIEIIKGPTAEFGGVAGTINVILRTPPRLRQRELRASLGYRKIAPQGSAALSFGDRVGRLGLHLPLAVYTWANGAEGQTLRRSVEPGGAVRELDQRHSDQWRGRGLNFAPRLDGQIGEGETLQWQGFFQGNESDNRSQRTSLALSGPPPDSVRSDAASRGQWRLARSQLQWVQRRPDGVRFELKASAQTSASRSAGSSAGQGADGGALLRRDSLASDRDSRFAQGGRLRLPLPADGAAFSAGWDLEQRQRRELRRLFEGGAEQFGGTLGSAFDARIRTAVLFGQVEWAPRERSSLSAGLRAEALQSTTAGPTLAAGSRSRALSPLLHWRHAFDAAGRDLLRASVARSIRVPEIGLLMPRYALNGAYERDVANTPVAADSAGNPQLQPERSTGFELALETHLAGGGVLSAGVYHRRIEQLIRRRIALESVPEASVPRWVSRPVNFGSARSSGLELELKGRAEQLLPAWAGARPGLTLRAALSLVRSRVEQIDDPDGRLDGQAPWGATLGFDQAAAGTWPGYGATLVLAPAFATQQTDSQRIWRGSAQRLDAYLHWRLSPSLQVRLAGINLLARDVQSLSTVEGLDGTAASAATRRDGVRQVTANLVLRF